MALKTFMSLLLWEYPKNFYISNLKAKKLLLYYDITIILKSLKLAIINSHNTVKLLIFIMK